MLYALKEVFDDFIEHTLAIRITSWATIKDALMQVSGWVLVHLM